MKVGLGKGKCPGSGLIMDYYLCIVSDRVVDRPARYSVVEQPVHAEPLQSIHEENRDSLQINAGKLQLQTLPEAFNNQHVTHIVIHNPKDYKDFSVPLPGMAYQTKTSEHFEESNTSGNNDEGNDTFDDTPPKSNQGKKTFDPKIRVRRVTLVAICQEEMEQEYCPNN